MNEEQEYIITVPNLVCKGRALEEFREHISELDGAIVRASELPMLMSYLNRVREKANVANKRAKPIMEITLPRLNASIVSFIYYSAVDGMNNGIMLKPCKRIGSIIGKKNKLNKPLKISILEYVSSKRIYRG